MQRVTSRQNPRLREAARAHRVGARPAQGRQVRARRRALVAVYAARHGAPETLIVTDEALGAARRARAGRAPCRTRTLVVPERCSPSSRRCRPSVGVLAVVRDAATRRSRAAADFCLLLDDVQDPGNVGSMLRSAAAAGVAQVLLSKHCAFAWSPKVLRAGQGAHFCLDIHEDVDLPAWAAAYRATRRRRRRHGRGRRHRPVRGAARRARRARDRQRRRRAFGRARRGGDAAGDDPDARRHRIAQRRGGGGRVPVRVRAAAGRRDRRDWRTPLRWPRCAAGANGRRSARRILA